MKEITTCEVFNTEDKKQMTITTEWLDDEVKIVLLRTGMVPLIGETTITKIWESSRAEKPREQTVQEIRNELSGKDRDVQFCLRETKLTWKKRVWRKGLVEMQPVEDIATLASMNIKWLGEYSTLQKTTSELQNDNEVLRKNADELVSKIKEMEKIKKSMEDTLYKQFLLLLNSKKRKIRELEEKLSSKDVPNNRNVYEENTDESDVEEKKPETNLRKRQKEEDVTSPIASTSKRTNKTPLNLTPDSDEEIVLRYDESQVYDFSKFNSEEDPEDDLFSQ